MPRSTRQRKKTLVKSVAKSRGRKIKSVLKSRKAKSKSRRVKSRSIRHVRPAIRKRKFRMEIPDTEDKQRELATKLYDAIMDDYKFIRTMAQTARPTSSLFVVQNFVREVKNIEKFLKQQTESLASEVYKVRLPEEEDEQDRQLSQEEKDEFYQDVLQTMREEYQGALLFETMYDDDLRRLVEMLIETYEQYKNIREEYLSQSIMGRVSEKPDWLESRRGVMLPVLEEKKRSRSGSGSKSGSGSGRGDKKRGRSRSPVRHYNWPPSRSPSPVRHYWEPIPPSPERPYRPRGLSP